MRTYLARVAHRVKCPRSTPTSRRRCRRSSPTTRTTRIDHLEENLGADGLRLSGSQLERLNALINQGSVTGARYNAATQTEVDTEEF